MIESRKEYELKLGNGDICYRVIIKSVECPVNGEMADLVKKRMLEQIVQNSDLLNAGGLVYDSFTFGHKDGRYIIESRLIKKNDNL